MKVSIIVPVFQVELYITECIQSLKNQSYYNIEVLIVDDGTKDNSIKIAKKIVADDNRFVFLEKQNGGLSDARNYGLKYATGDMITFIDSDDYVGVDYIKKMVMTFINNDCEIVVCNYKTDCTVLEDKKENEIFDAKEVIDFAYSKSTSIQFTTAWGMLVPKSFYFKNFFPKGKIHEDEFTTYKLFLQANKIAYLNECLYYYRLRKNSIMSTKVSLKNLVVLEALEEKIQILKEKNIAIKKTLIAYYRKICFFKIKLSKKSFMSIKGNLNQKFDWINQQLKFEELTFKERIKLLAFKYFGFIVFK